MNILDYNNKVEQHDAHTPGIYKKIHNIMKEFKFIKMEGHISFKGTDYDYLSEQQVTSMVHGELIKQGVIMYPSEINTICNQDHTKTTVEVTYMFVDIDDGSSIKVSVIGKGKDNQDKDAGKAMTGAFKYAQRQVFHLQTGKEDPDRDASGKQDEKDKTTKDKCMDIGKKLKSEENKGKARDILMDKGKDIEEKLALLKKIQKEEK